MRDERLPKLNVLFGHRPLQKVVVDNELLQDLGIGWLNFVDAKRDLKFQLGIQSYKSAQAIALYLTVIRAAVDPKVRKTANFVTDVEVLDLAKDLLREVTTHVIAELQGAHDSFFAVGDRAQNSVVAQLDRLAQGRRRKTQQAKGGGLLSGNGHAAPNGLLERERLTRHDQWPNAMPERGTTAQRRIAGPHTGEGAHAQLREVELTLMRAPVEFFDVEQHRTDATWCGNETERERVKGKRVVGARRIPDCELTHDPGNLPKRPPRPVRALGWRR
jgi:hypothetical protein